MHSDTLKAVNFRVMEIGNFGMNPTETMLLHSLALRMVHVLRSVRRRPILVRTGANTKVDLVASEVLDNHRMYKPQSGSGII